MQALGVAPDATSRAAAEARLDERVEPARGASELREPYVELRLPGRRRAQRQTAGRSLQVDIGSKTIYGSLL